MFDINAPENSPAVNADVQEALSRRYSDDIIMLLPLKSGNIAIFNAARELCGFQQELEFDEELFWEGIMEKWHPPVSAPPTTKPSIDLEELELL